MNQAQRLGRAAAYASWAQHLSAQVDALIQDIGRTEYDAAILGPYEISLTDRLMEQITALTGQAKRCAAIANREAWEALTCPT